MVSGQETVFCWVSVWELDWRLHQITKGKPEQTPALPFKNQKLTRGTGTQDFLERDNIDSNFIHIFVEFQLSLFVQIFFFTTTTTTIPSPTTETLHEELCAT
jgi:hypothetical protein